MKLNGGLKITSNGYGSSTIHIDVELSSVEEVDDLQAYCRYALKFTKAWAARCAKHREKLNVTQLGTTRKGA